ncbi:MAG: hypothetical protein J6M60_01745 [Clostridia bacterium]|nr:hypothetical protein [Clostridia bacterium]
MKKTISIIIVAILLATGLFVLTGCENGGDNTKKINGVEISETLGKGKITVVVPKKEDGTAKYGFTKDKPKEAKSSGTFYLETDTAVFSFGTHSLVYNTGKEYKEKHGETEATFDGYLAFVEDTTMSSRPRLSGMEKLEINGRKAIRYHSKTGGSGNYVYHGYDYAISADDIYKGSDLEIGVYYKGEEVKESKEFDQETLDIINSLKIELNQQ